MWYFSWQSPQIDNPWLAHEGEIWGMIMEYKLFEVYQNISITMQSCHNDANDLLKVENHTPVAHFTNMV